MDNPPHMLYYTSGQPLPAMAPSTQSPNTHLCRLKGHSDWLDSQTHPIDTLLLPKVAHGGLKFFWWYDKISYAPALSTVRPFCRQAKSDFCWPVRPLPCRWLGRWVFWFWYGVWGYKYVCGGSWEDLRKFFLNLFFS